MEKIRPIEILLVDDNYADTRFVQESFKDEEMVSHNLHIVTDGTDALSFLKKENKYKNVPMPDIILLDLNLPKLNGDEVLKQIKSDINLKHIPVVILTSSNDGVIISRMYELQASCCINKPVDTEKFLAVLEKLKNWIDIINFPH